MSALALLTLSCAIVGEVFGTASLRMASAGTRLWWVGVASGYVFAFVMLSVALSEDLPLGVAYGIWTAAGVALTAILSRVLFHEPLTWLMTAGLVLIAVGVLLIELGAAH